jgi:hypothetical protein
MRIFKYKTFEKWAKKQGMHNTDLKKAINELEGFKTMADAFLSLNNKQLKTLIDEQKLIEVL